MVRLLDPRRSRIKPLYITEDLRNAGVLGAGEGVREAAAVIGWQVHFLVLGSKDVQREGIFDKALSLRPDGVILGGGDALAYREFLLRFEQQGIPIVNWHASAFIDDGFGYLCLTAYGIDGHQPPLFIFNNASRAKMVVI
jgi:ABC-type sugar transport system substrate-binding protein